MADESKMTITNSAALAGHWRRQHDAKAAAARRVVEDHAAAMRFGNPFRDRQPQARAGSAAGALESHESIEDAIAVGRGDPWTVVRHRDLDPGGRPRQREPDRAAGRGVTNRVLHEVPDHLLDQLFVAFEGHVL